MKKIALTLSALGLITAATVAQAAIVNSTDLTTDQAKALVQEKGAVVLSTAPGIYDRYVSSNFYCGSHEVTKRAYIPTLDSDSAPIGYKCVVGNNGN